MGTVIREEIVKPMTRGQITLPASMRAELGIDSETWLWVKLLSNNGIYIEPVKKKRTDLYSFLIKHFSDRKVYWTDDVDYLKETRKKSIKRLKDLYKEE